MPMFRNKIRRTYGKPTEFARSKWHAFRAFHPKKQLAIIGVLVLGFLIFTPIASYAYFVRDINDPERLMNRNSTGINITDRNDETIYSSGRTAATKLYKLPEISDHAEKALLASEDKSFYEHSGFSIKGMAGALFANITNRDLTKYGGSTLTQQLVKNNLLTDSKNIIRKYQELSIAVAVERNYTKDEILEMYLNSVYFGEGAFGIEQAAKTYFGKAPQDLTLAESSMLIGLLPAPSAYSPVSGDAELAKKQQERVLGEMVAAGYITDEEKTAAIAQPLAYSENAEVAQSHAHHFTQMVMKELRDRYGEERVARSGFSVRTSLDLGAQKHAEQTIKDRIAVISSQGAHNAALVAIDPKSGEIKALVGSAEWTNPQFGQVNMAITPRQPGSSFKPIYYAEALDQKLITPATVIRDERKSYGSYRPENYDFRYRGDITVRYALAQSLNIPAVEVMQKLGVDQAAATAKQMGINSITEPEKYGLSLALGSAEAQLLEMTNAYAAFANEGMQYQATSILSIKDKYGSTIYSSRPDARRAQSAEASYLMSSILSDRQARAPLSGSAFNMSGRDVAVKTGTTDDNVDAWTIGYTPSLAVGVWIGNNDHAEMSVGGTYGAGPIWRSTMQHMLGNSRAESFVMPATVVKQQVCTVNGTYEEYFVKGTEQSDPCDRQKRDREEARRKQEEDEKRQEREREQAEREAERLREEQENLEQEEAEDDDEPTTTTPPTEDGTASDGTTSDGTDSGTGTTQPRQQQNNDGGLTLPGTN